MGAWLPIRLPKCVHEINRAMPVITPSFKIKLELEHLADPPFRFIFLYGCIMAISYLAI